MSHKKWIILSIVLVTLVLPAAVTAQPSYREETARLTPDQAIAVALKDAAPAGAAYPADINPEIGTNDFRLSDMGPDGNTAYYAQYPAVAYNSTDDEYLVVWMGTDDTPPLVVGEYEIFGQLVDATDGSEIGGDFRLSDMGPDGNTAYYAQYPAVAYNSADNEYLVVWGGRDGLIVNEIEIYGQRVSAAGVEDGTNDFRLSDMGPDGNESYGAWHPAIAYNSADNEYLVVWAGRNGSIINEREIYGQRVSAAGAEVGTNDFCLSDMGPAGDENYRAVAPAVAYNSTANEYLVVWQSDDDTGDLVDNEDEIYGQRVSAAGSQVGTNDFRLSDMGPDGDVSYCAGYPAVAYNSTDNEYLVVWMLEVEEEEEGEDNTAPLVDEGGEIYGQRVSAAGAEVGTNDFRLSDMGPDGDVYYSAHNPAVAYNPTDNEYLAVWGGEDDTAPLVDNELEIFGQRVDAATGAEVGANDFRLSDMGPDGNTAYYAQYPAAAYNGTSSEYLVVWYGSDDILPLVAGENEIYGQRVGGVTSVYLPLVIRE